ncbi:hypothetical protein [Microbacterium phyllosphaerae]|uniref:hypothetical protein n=1 Tax=Microbacterium phyllosphaerae TaxID=124798 RepID=UPI003D64A8B1
MKETPLDIAPGDIVYLALANPLRLDDDGGGEDLRYEIRVQVDSATVLGLTCRNSWIEPGPIVPSAFEDAEYMGGGGKLEFFPWSAVVRMSLLYTFAEYEEKWDGRR